MPSPDQMGSPFPAARSHQLGDGYGGKLTALAELPIHALGDDYEVEGSGTVLSLPVMPPGNSVSLRLLATPTFKNSAKLICPNGVDYVGKAGDLVTARSDGDSVWRLFVKPASGSQLADQSLSTNSTQQAQIRANAGVLGRNRIINGQFAINQRGAVSVADNAYGPDRFRVIGEFATGTIFTDAFDAAGGSVPGGALQFGGTTDKGGYFQVIEGRNCKDLRGKTVTLSMRLVVNNTRLGNMKIGILEWTGTEDATTGDPVSSWGADGVTPTLAINWAFKNTPTNLNVTTSSAVYSASATLGSTFTNLAVMIWNDDKSYTAGDNFGITNVQLEEGGVATPYDQRILGQELYFSQRYFSLLPGWVGKWISTTACQLSGSFWTKMRATPSVTVVFGTAALNDYGVANINLVSFSAAALGDSGGYMNLNTATGTANALCGYLDNVGKVFLSAEI